MKRRRQSQERGRRTATVDGRQGRLRSVTTRNRVPQRKSVRQLRCPRTPASARWRFNAAHLYVLGFIDNFLHLLGERLKKDLQLLMIVWLPRYAILLVAEIHGRQVIVWIPARPVSIVPRGGLRSSAAYPARAPLPKPLAPGESILSDQICSNLTPETHKFCTALEAGQSP